MNEIGNDEWQEIVNEEAALRSLKTLKNAWGLIRNIVKDETEQYPLEVTWSVVTPSNKSFLMPNQIKVFDPAASETPYAVPALPTLSSLRISEIAALERKRKAAGPVMPYGQNCLRQAIHRICAEYGLPAVSIHGLRHSFASLAHHLQMPEKIAMEIGGGADATTIHRIYTHIAKSDIKRNQTAMMQFYSSESVSEETQGRKAG